MFLELPLDPVTAEDGFIYEERDIKEWIRKKQADGDAVTSPRTNAQMGTKLLPAVQVRNNIKDLVSNGVIDGELAKQWKKSMDAKEKVETTKKRVEHGDVDAMLDLGKWYRHGKFGLTKSDEESYKWYKQAADLKDTRGMASAGWRLVKGVGVEKSGRHGLVLISLAAERGSDCACAYLGSWYLRGKHGLPKDKEEAMRLLRRATDGSCSVHHLNGEFKKKAKAMLQELETIDDEENDAGDGE
mmetsp:Transcript_36737/g.74859  ORF Transcript_36737/g.74859 Transcript_36737/m.74859 type:complete len:243 (-) Transcript_36737:124-852(-)